MFDTDRERAALVSVAAPWMGPSVLAPVLDAADLWTIGYSVLPGVAAPPEPVSYSAVGDLRAAVALASPTTAGAGPVAATAVGDLRAVVALAAITTGPGGGAITGGRAVVTLPMRWVVEGDLGVVVGLTARTAVQRARPRAVVAPPVPRHHTVRAEIGLHATLTSRARFHDVIEADDEDVLVLLGGALMMTTLDALIAEGQTLRRPTAAAAPGAARWSIRADAGAPAHLYLYGPIGWPGIEAGPVVEGLRAIHTRPLQVHINSQGGDVFDGLGLYNTLRAHGAPVDIRVEGYAASIASLIAMGGATLRMAAASFLMIHEPHALVIGDAHDMRHMAGLLDKASGVLADVYATRGLDRDQVRAWMHAETWWPARAALAAGLIDAVDDDPVPAEALAASATVDVSVFRRPPGAEPPPAAKPAARARDGARHLITALELLVGAPARTQQETHP